jgi:hypothetical protein
MKQPTRGFFRLSSIILLFVCVVAAALAQGETSLVGTWQSKEANASMTLILNADGTGKLDDASIKYTVEGNKLKVNEDGVVNNYTFSLRGNVLTVSGGDLAQPLVFERQTGKGLGARRNQLADNANTSTPAGEWERRAGQQVFHLNLKPDGTGTLNEMSFKWTFEQGVLSFSDGNTTLMYNATISAESLKLSGGSPPTTTLFERVAKRAGSGASQTKQPRTNSGGLTGRWKSRDYALQVNADGTVLINGEAFRYSVQGNVITLITDAGSAQIPFQLEGDTLVTTFNGQRTVYTRESESADAVGGGSASAELAGKWCYMSNVNANNGGRMSNRCITLYPNGTYEYYAETSSSGQYGSTASQDSDSGTWRATATSITANSRKHGVLTYSLQKRNHPKTGDAMIVLDGDAFVTSTQRPPW